MTTWQKAAGWGIVDRPAEGEHGGTLYAADLGSGLIHRLEGAAAVVTRAAVSGLSTQEVVDAAAASFGVPHDDIDAEALTELLTDLQRLGVLRRG